MNLSPTVCFVWLPVTLSALLAASGCGGGAAPAQGMPPMPVELREAVAVPIEDVTEYIATVKSRDSAVIMPEVEGRITEILVRSGQRVAAGTPLVQIDPARQRATVKSQHDTRAAKQASLAFARQDFERVEALH